MLDQIYEAEFWVAVAFVVLLAIFWKLGVHRTAVAALDDRASRIKSELDEALRLREEAKNLLADAERRRRDAEQEGDAIIAGARGDAERVAAEARTKAEEFVARRTKMAETRIAQAEQQAIADVRAAAAEAAVAAAERVLRDTVTGKVADDLIGKGVSEIKSRLN
jgi:F-type H+-transporting ATPase subunit b